MISLRFRHAALIVAAVVLVLRASAAQADEGPGFVVQPNLASNITSIGWQKTGPFLPEVSFGPSVRVGEDWGNIAAYGHLAYSSSFGVIGGYNGTQLLILGPDVAPVFWRSPDQSWSAYLVAGANAGLGLVSNNFTSQTDADFAFGFLAGAGLRDEDHELMPSVEAGTRTELLRDNGTWVGTSSLYVAVNLSFGAPKRHGKKGDGATTKEKEKPPPAPAAPEPAPTPEAVAPKEDCPEARVKATRAEDAVSAAKKELDTAQKGFAAADATYQQFHKTLPEDADKVTADQRKTDDANREAGGAAEKKVTDAKKKLDDQKKEAIRLRAICDPVIPQPTQNECAATSVRMIVKSKTGKDPGQAFCPKPKPGYGIKAPAAADLLKKNGVPNAAPHPNGNLGDLANATKDGDPVIVDVALGDGQHAIVVDRVIADGDGGYTVVYRDPVNGGSSGIMSGDDLNKGWDDGGKKPYVSTNPPPPPK